MIADAVALAKSWLDAHRAYDHASSRPRQLRASVSGATAGALSTVTRIRPSGARFVGPVCRGRDAHRGRENDTRHASVDSHLS